LDLKPGEPVQPRPTKVLLVDDDQGDFEMIRVMLSQAEHGQFRVDWVATFEEALDAFEKDEHDVYFVDYFLEDRTGLDLLREAQRRGISGPLIMLTGRGSRDVAMKALEAGAADYLVKGLIDPAALERSIRHARERTQGVSALRESEERHRSMFEHLPVGLYRTAPDGTFMEANPALIRILGYPDRESLAHRYSSALFVHPDDRERFWSLLEQYGVARGFESALRRPDGTSIRVRNTARLHRDAKGDILYLEGVLEDFPEEQAPAADPNAGEARFRAVFEASRSGIALVDLDGLLLEVNPAFAEMFSAQAHWPEGLSLVELLDKNDQAPFLGGLEDLSRGMRTRLEAERRFLGKDGTLIWARTTTVLIRNGEGEPDHVVVVLEVRP
jgi:PAS domain S-box-containing protein